MDNYFNSMPLQGYSRQPIWPTLPQNYSTASMPENYTPTALPQYNVPTPINNALPPLPSLPGKIINTESDIAANEVPSDGSVGLYLCKDLSCLYAKAWNNNGQIDTVKFVREEPTRQLTPVEELEQKMNDRFDKLEKMIINKGGNKNGKFNNGSSNESDRKQSSNQE